MAAQLVPTLDFSAQIVGSDGRLTEYGYRLLKSLIERTGGQSDKVDAAHALASGAVAQGTAVVAGGGLQDGGALGGNIGLSLYAGNAPLAVLPTVVRDGDWGYASDGCKPGESTGAGTGVPCFWSGGSGGAWVSACSGAAVTT